MPRRPSLGTKDAVVSENLSSTSTRPLDFALGASSQFAPAGDRRAREPAAYDFRLANRSFVDIGFAVCVNQLCLTVGRSAKADACCASGRSMGQGAPGKALRGLRSEAKASVHAASV